jgi:hypothetical protein
MILLAGQGEVQLRTGWSWSKRREILPPPVLQSGRWDKKLEGDFLG